jgi:hypothetical protein
MSYKFDSERGPIDPSPPFTYMRSKQNLRITLSAKIGADCFFYIPILPRNLDLNEKVMKYDKKGILRKF